MMTTNCGTAHFAAPEVLRLPGESLRTLYGVKADVYSVGMLLWTIASRELPYSHCRNNASVARLVKDGQRPPSLHRATPVVWQQLVDACLSHDETSRPEMAVVRSLLEQHLI